MKMLSYMENFIKNTFAEKIEDRMKDSAEVKTFIIGQVEQEFLGKFKQEPIVLVVLSNDK